MNAWRFTLTVEGADLDADAARAALAQGGCGDCEVAIDAGTRQS